MVIYKITNTINQKVYIGQTKEFKRRIQNHFKTAENGWVGAEKPLYKAIKKYGAENFTVDILCTVDSYEELNEKEIYFINLYNSTVDGNGYNLDHGGKNGKKSEITKRKIGEAQKGELNHMYGKTFENSPNSKPIINITKNKIYVSLRKCALEEYNDEKAVKQISKVCNPNSNRYSYQGQVYAFLDKNGVPIKKKKQPIKASAKKIIDKKTGIIYPSFAEASRQTGLSTGMIRDRAHKRLTRDDLKDKYDFDLID